MRRDCILGVGLVVATAGVGACGGDETNPSNAATTTTSVSSTGAGASGGVGASGGMGATGGGGSSMGGMGGNTGGVGGVGGNAGGAGGLADCANLPTTAIPGDACDAYAEALCTLLESCNNIIFKIFFGTKTECLLFADQGCNFDIGQMGIDETPAQVEACAEKLVNAGCAGCTAEQSCGFTPGGTLANNTACEGHGQCLSGFCDGADAVTCGTCSPTVAAGGDCSSNPNCVDGYYCDTATCLADKAVGDACAMNYECGNNECVMGMCGPGLGAGADCTNDPCDFSQGLFCIQDVCTVVPINGPGQTCGFDLALMTLELCQGDTFCNAQPQGICEAKKALGAACTLFGSEPSNPTDHNCLQHLWCVNSVCTAATDLVCP